MLIETIKDFLNGQNWHFTQINQQNILFFGISGENGKFKCYIDLDEEEERLSFVSIYKSSIPADREFDILKLLNIINQRVFLGRFEMDWDSGEIKFKTNVFYHLDTPESFWIEEIIMTNISTMDASLPAIIAITHGDKSIEDSLEFIRFNEEEDKEEQK